MTNAELIEALRCCIVDFNSTQSRRCNECPYRIYADGKYGCENKLKADAADALEAADKRIAELMPKEGEWIIDGMNEYELSYGCIGYEPRYRCSKCGITTESYLRTERPIMPEDADFPNYCPNCGSVMKGGCK